jgi:hypothetical protein
MDSLNINKCSATAFSSTKPNIQECYLYVIVATTLPLSEIEKSKYVEVLFFTHHLSFTFLHYFFPHSSLALLCFLSPAFSLPIVLFFIPWIFIYSFFSSIYTFASRIEVLNEYYEAHILQ